MPIANYRPDEQLPVKPNLPAIQNKDVKTVLIDDSETPIRSLVSFVEGAPWSVTYYSQYVSLHNDIREIDPGSPNITQQYQKINHYEIRVTNPLASTYDSGSGITTVSGSGNVYGTILPNKGDNFIADAGLNKKGIFVVKTVERHSFNLESSFFIEYTLLNYIDTQPGIDTLAALEDRVIRTYYYDKERLLNNLQPLVKENDYNIYINLKASYVDILNYYFETFYNKRYGTLVLPGQEEVIYDHFLVRYLRKIVSVTDHISLNYIKDLPTDEDTYLEQKQFWNAMLNKDFSLLNHCNKTMGVVNTSNFNNNPWLKGLYFRNIAKVIYPLDVDVTSNVKELPVPRTDYVLDDKIMETSNRFNTQVTDINLVYNDGVINTVYFYPVFKDNYYVMSLDFYTNTSSKSLIEILTKDYLTKQTLDLVKLQALINSYKTWSRLEQFYYGPVLLTLIKEADRGIYT